MYFFVDIEKSHKINYLIDKSPAIYFKERGYATS